MARRRGQGARRLALCAALAASAACAPGLREPAVAQPSEPLVEGNRAELLFDGPAAHRAMLAAIAAARDHIHLETYIIDAGEAGERFADALIGKAREGRDVRLLYDSVGSIGTPEAYFEHLRAGGVAVCEFNPVASRPTRVNNRNHRKVLVVDGRVAFTGGINVSETYLASSSRARRVPDREADREEGWRDTQVQVAGPVVAQFQRLFLDSWAAQDCPRVEGGRPFPKLEREGTLAMRVVAAVPGQGSEMYAALLDALAQARRRAWLTFGYFVPDPAMKGALDAAARRGVDVRLVLPGFSDFWAPVYAGRSHYADLLEAGVRIYEWHDALMHAKTAVIDSRWSSVGSTNLDWRSFVHNYEADLVVRDAGFARVLEQRFERDAAAAVQIQHGAWAERGFAERVKEWLARQWEYLL